MNLNKQNSKFIFSFLICIIGYSLFAQSPIKNEETQFKTERTVQYNQNNANSHVLSGIYSNVNDKYKYIVIRNDTLNYNCWTYTPINSQFRAIANGFMKYKFAYINNNNNNTQKDTFSYTNNEIVYNNEKYKLYSTNTNIHTYLEKNKIAIYTIVSGMSASNISLYNDNIYYNNKLIATLLSNEKYLLIITKQSPSKRYMAFMTYDPDNGGSRMFIVDTRNHSGIVIDGFNTKTNLLEPIDAWISWSPNESYALIAHAMEFDILYDLQLINLKEKQTKVLPIKSFERIYKHEKDFNIKEIQSFDLESVKWVNNTMFNFNMTLHCNIGDDCNCSNAKYKKVLRTYHVNINISTNAITYGLVN